MEDNGHAQYRSRHKKVDLTAVVTTLLVQVDCVVTTTSQCLTKDVLDKDTRSVHVQVKIPLVDLRAMHSASSLL